MSPPNELKRSGLLYLVLLDLVLLEWPQAPIGIRHQSAVKPERALLGDLFDDLLQTWKFDPMGRLLDRLDMECLGLHDRVIDRFKGQPLHERLVLGAKSVLEMSTSWTNPRPLTSTRT